MTNFALYQESVRGGRFDPVLMLGRTRTDSAKGGDAEKGTVLLSAAEGAAVFDAARMKGALDARDTLLLLLGRGDFKSGSITLRSGARAVTLHLLSDRRNRVELSLSPLAVRVEIRLKCRLQQDSSSEDASQQGFSEALQQELEEKLAGELQRVFLRCQAWNADAMGFGRYASMEFHDTKSWEEYGWKRCYPELHAEFQVQLQLQDENIAEYME